MLCHSTYPSVFTSPAPTTLSPLSLHDALPIYEARRLRKADAAERSLRLAALAGERQTLLNQRRQRRVGEETARKLIRSEEHTSELQSRGHLVCRLLLEKKKRRENTRKDKHVHK